jgi:DNA-binding winged helix-turn-helix (wHTH) protein
MLTDAAPAVPRSRGPFRLLDVEVRPATNELVVAGRVQRVKPRLMDVLLRLAAEGAGVVTRETLLDDAWPRRMVNDEVLSRVIADLRAVLGDNAREARYIETIPKVGYRLIAPVVELDAAAGGAPVAPPAAQDDSTMPAAPARAPLPPAIAVGHDAGSRRTRHRWWWVVAAVAGGAAAVWLARVPAPAVGAPDRAALERQLAQAEPFSSDVAIEVGPRFSPDGSKVAYAAGEGGRAVIEVRGVGTAERATLGDPADLNLNPVFFPDGARVAYFRRKQDGTCGIVAQDVRGSAARPLVDCAREPRAQFDLAPDGRHLVYVAATRPQFPAGLVVRDLDTGVDRTLTAPEPGDGDDLLPRFSPDGARILFFRGTASHRQLWLVDRGEGASARSAGSPRGLAYGGAWLGPRGPLLVAADWFGLRALNRFDLDTGTAEMVGGRGARAPDVDRRGNIVFENAVYAANLFLVDVAAADAPPRAMWTSTRYTNQAEFSPDGRHVVFASNRDGASGLFVAALDGAAARIALPEDYIYMRPHWSQDGGSIYATRASRRNDASPVQQGIRIAWPAGTVEVLSALGENVVDVREAAAGRALIVGEIAGNAVRVLRQVGSGVPERLPLPLVSEYQVQGNRIAFAQPELAGLTLCDLATLQCGPLPLPIDESNRFDWLLTQDAVWYRGGARPGALVRYDLAARRETWRSAFAPTALGLSIAVPPDGRAVLVAREAPTTIDLLLAPRRAR